MTDYNDEIMNMLALGAGAVSAYKTYAVRHKRRPHPDPFFGKRVEDFDRMEKKAREFSKNHLHEIEAIPDMMAALKKVQAIRSGAGWPEVFDQVDAALAKAERKDD